MSSPARDSGESGASSERSSLAETEASGSPVRRLVGRVNTCSLSFDLIGNRMERYREAVQHRPSWPSLTAPPPLNF